MTSYPPPPQGPPNAPPPGQPFQQPAQQQTPPPPPSFGPQGPPAPGLIPAPPGVTPIPKVPPVAWLIPLAALLAVIGVFTPWFKPHADKGGQSVGFDALYSFKDGKIGLVAPIALVVIALGVFSLARGRVKGRLAGSADPIRLMAKYALGVGVVSLVCLLIAWFLVTTQYKFELNGSEYSWSDFEAKLKTAGATLSRGPQIGYWLTLVGALLAIVAGVVLLVQAKSSAPAQPVGAAAGTLPPPPSGYPQAGPSLDKPSV
jgi:hypothetical protein